MNLLEIKDNNIIEKTNQTRKICIAGETKIYPVYRVHLDMLYYNDQNDRITTWLTQYRAQNGENALKELTKEAANEIIESFIIESNPDALKKTKNNIYAVGQNVAGVILKDGRVIDGNRRFTCLRILSREKNYPPYFETAILEGDYEETDKQIKILELSIQHAEEEKVGYDLIDYAIGAYHNIVEQKIFTVEEYAKYVNLPVPEIKKKLSVATLIKEYLEFMGVSEQYQIARELQVYSVFHEFLPLLQKAKPQEVEIMKKSVFANIMMNSYDDHRHYIRELKKLSDSPFFSDYMKEQIKLSEKLEGKKNQEEIKSVSDIKKFVNSNQNIQAELHDSLDDAVNLGKRKIMLDQPSKVIEKSISNLTNIDTRILEKLDVDEKKKIKIQLQSLASAVESIGEEVNTTKDENAQDNNQEQVVEEAPKRPYCALFHPEEPRVLLSTPNRVISTLSISLQFRAMRDNTAQPERVKYLAYFIDDKNEQLSEITEVDCDLEYATTIPFILNSRTSFLKKAYLVLKSMKDKENEAQSIYDFDVRTSFAADFDF